jgi:hypothetical protein
MHLPGRTPGAAFMCCGLSLMHESKASVFPYNALTRNDLRGCIKADHYIVTAQEFEERLDSRAKMCFKPDDVDVWAIYTAAHRAAEAAIPAAARIRRCYHWGDTEDLPDVAFDITFPVAPHGVNIVKNIRAVCAAVIDAAYRNEEYQASLGGGAVRQSILNLRSAPVAIPGAASSSALTATQFVAERLFKDRTHTVDIVLLFRVAPTQDPLTLAHIKDAEEEEEERAGKK